MRNIYNLLAEPIHGTYEKLIWFSLRYCDKFQYVVPHHINQNRSVQEIIKKFEKFQISIKEKSEWPGTKLLRGTATVYQYVLNEESTILLIDSNNSLYSWVQPDFPEDLCLIRTDNTSWFVSTTYERDGYFELAPDEMSELEELIPGLILSKHNVDKVD